MLVGRKVVLRPLGVQDLPSRLAMINDPQVQAMTLGLQVDPTTAEDLASWLELVTSDPYREQWAIETTAGVYIGDIDFHSINVVPGEAWMALMIGDEHYLENVVYRREAVTLLVAYALRSKGIQRLLVDIPDADQVGIEILLELGFEKIEEIEVDLFTGAKMVTFELVSDNYRG